jgi:hypothetical protein
MATTRARVSCCSSRTCSRRVYSRPYLMPTTSTKDGAPATHLRRARAKHQRAVHTAARAVRLRPIVFLNAFFDALEFLKASWIAARPPIFFVQQSNWLREPMDGRRAHRAKPVLVTIPEKFSGGGSPWGATRRKHHFRPTKRGQLRAGSDFSRAYTISRERGRWHAARLF